MLGTAIREERERQGLRLEDLARRAYISRSTLSAYEREERPIPPDAKARLIQALGNVRLAQVNCCDCPACLIPVPPLDGVDLHPLAVLGKAIEELSEAEQALRMCDLINKPDAGRLTDLDRGVIDRAAEQVADVLPAIYTLLTVFHERYRVDVRAVAGRLQEKLRARGYVSARRRVA